MIRSPRWADSRLRGLTLLLPALAAVACWQVPDVDRRTITEWLVCTECVNGELQRVIGNGERMVPYLEAALAEGPTPYSDSLATRQAVEQVFRTRRYRSSRSMNPLSDDDSATVVQRHLDEFNLTYRLRAAQALQQLDSTAARNTVETYCATRPPELTRRPEFRSSFGRIGECP